ncbi:MAG: hypothetical protein AAF747_02810 [Planctomycetota bacterium]
MIDTSQSGFLSSPTMLADVGPRIGSTPSATEDRRQFLSMLGIENRMQGQSDAALADQHREAAEELVAVTFIEPILKQMRESSTAPPPWGPGPGEKKFRSLMDGQVARDLVQASDFPLVDRLARDLRGYAASDAARPRMTDVEA